MNTYRVSITGKDPVVTQQESVDDAVNYVMAFYNVEHISGDVETIEVEVNPIDA
jgi:hypothetical protein